MGARHLAAWLLDRIARGVFAAPGEAVLVMLQDYSVPVAYGHREVLVRGYVETVVIACGAAVIARHGRSYEREDVLLEPLHYLPLLERKTGALDQAAPLAGWDLPEVFLVLRRLLVRTRHNLKRARSWSSREERAARKSAIRACRRPPGGPRRRAASANGAAKNGAADAPLQARRCPTGKKALLDLEALFE